MLHPGSREKSQALELGEALREALVGHSTLTGRRLVLLEVPWPSEPCPLLPPLLPTLGPHTHILRMPSFSFFAARTLRPSRGFWNFCRCAACLSPCPGPEDLMNSLTAASRYPLSPGLSMGCTPLPFPSPGPPHSWPNRPGTHVLMILSQPYLSVTSDGWL